jgi:predicted lipoprotein with Yx(FWY)xxD motif
MQPTKLVMAAAAFGVLSVACGSAVTQTGQSHAATSPQAVRPVLNEADNPRLGQILTDAQGRTLYHFLPEKDGKVNCTGQCAGIWTPLVASGTTPTHDPALGGTVGTVTRPDGTLQVTYYDWPLYTFTGDEKPGDASGQAVAGMWFAQPATAPVDADNDNDGTTAPPPTATPAPVAAQPAQQPPAQERPPTPAPLPGFNDGDADNRGGPNDGDGNG